MVDTMTTAEFEFELIFTLPSGAVDEALLADALFGAGLDDAIVGLGQRRTVGLNFRRSGVSADAVVSDALTAALSALPDGSELRELRQ